MPQIFTVIADYKLRLCGNNSFTGKEFFSLRAGYENPAEQRKTDDWKNHWKLKRETKYKIATDARNEIL